MPSQRLLILDDDLAIGQTIAMIADAVGVSARFTSSHEEFFRLEIEWQPTHIALDLVMPQMDGVQVLAKLAQRGTKACIIITSGQGGRVLDAAGRSAAEHGLDIAGVLPKPFSSGTLRGLLQAGSGGRQQLTHANPGTHPSRSASTERFQVSVEELQRAFAEKELLVYFQPKVHCVTLALAGFEAMVRWQHPQHGIINPDQFISFAEEHDLIGRLTDQVFDIAFNALTRWRVASRDAAAASGGPDLFAAVTLSVNLSVKSLDDKEFVERLTDLCRVNRIDPAGIILEVTETGAMEHPTASLDLLTRFRLAGFQVSIDDFGTGYSSMLQLARLPFSELKVDKSFVMTAAHSAESRSVIRCIVELGRSLGLKTTAEGVEDEVALKYLNEIGCDCAQGFFFSRPMPEDAVMPWVLERTQG